MKGEPCGPLRSHLIEIPVAASMMNVTEPMLRALLATYGIEIKRDAAGKECASGSDLRQIYDRARSQ
jgi:hypothetical protein